MLDWFEQNAWWLLLASVGSLVIAVVALPLVVLRLPTDYFSRPASLRTEERSRRGPFARVGRLALTAFGGVFLLAGILLLFLPGQGLLMMLIGVLLMEFPGKHRLEQWLVRQPGIGSTMNKLRVRRGLPPLVGVTRDARPESDPPQESDAPPPDH